MRYSRPRRAPARPRRADARDVPPRPVPPGSDRRALRRARRPRRTPPGAGHAARRSRVGAPCGAGRALRVRRAARLGFALLRELRSPRGGDTAGGRLSPVRRCACSRREVLCGLRPRRHSGAAVGSCRRSSRSPNCSRPCRRPRPNAGKSEHARAPTFRTVVSALRCAARSGSGVLPRVRLPAVGRERRASAGSRTRGSGGSPGIPGDWIWPVLLFLAAGGRRRRGGDRPIGRRSREQHDRRDRRRDAALADDVRPERRPWHLADPSPRALPPGRRRLPTAPPPATTTAAPPGALVAWPAGESGYTVVLESIPAGGGGHSLATPGRGRPPGPDCRRWVSSTRAGFRAFTRATTSFSAGSTRREAGHGAMAGANAKGFRAAYVRQITR